MSIIVMNAYTGSVSFADDGYHLLSTSAGIDRGVSTELLNDIDGHIRDNLPDLGADEYMDTLYLPLIAR